MTLCPAALMDRRNTLVDIDHFEKSFAIMAVF